MRASSLVTFLALSSVAVLPACSMFGGGSGTGGGGGRQASATTPTSPTRAATPNYNTTQGAAGTELAPNMIRKVQQNLKQAGLYNARVDGVWGPQTVAAVRDYQQQHNLNASGELDEPTLDAMNLGTSNTNQSNAAGQSNQNGAQQSANYNPPPQNNSGQANYNPPATNNAPDQTSNNNTGTNTPR